MDDANDYENTASEAPDDATLYVDCIRLLEGGHVQRFENIASKFDMIRYELSDGPSKSLLFYAIELNNEEFVNILLEMEVSLDKKFSVS